MKPVAKFKKPFGFRMKLFTANFCSHAHTDNASNIKSSATHTALVAAAIKHCIKSNAGIFSTNIKSTNAFRTIHFVGGHTKKIDAHIFNIHWDFPNGLCCISVKKHAFSFADCADFFHGMNGTDFIVGSHNADNDSFVGNGISDLLW